MLRFEYDAGNRLVRALDATGASVRYELDILGRPRSVTDPNGLVRRYTYYGPEQNGRLKSTTDPLGRTTSYEYDVLGRSSRSVDALGRDSYRFYNAANRPVREVGPIVTDPVYGSVRPVTLQRYDLLGALVEVRYGHTSATAANNPAADVTTVQASYVSDDFGRLLRETDAGGRIRQYAWDRYGNRTRMTDPKGQVTTWTYGYGGRLPTLRTDASGRKTTYTYDPLGQLTRVASLDASGSPVIAYDYGYDEAARLSRVTDSRAGQWLGYQWSPGGQLNRLTDSDGRATAYQYGPSGRLTSLWAPDGEQLSLAYDAGGRLLERRFGNGAGSRFAWNADGTLAQRQNFANAANTLVSQHDYAYDALGRRTRHLEQIAGTSTDYRYTYDGLGRLSEARNAGGTLLEGYTYDLTGNRLTRTLVYDPNGSLTRQCSGSSVTRSTNTCTGSDVASYGYDALDRLAQASLTGNQTLTESYGYDPQGRRILKTTNGAKTQYRYAGDDLYADYGTSLATPRTLYLQGAGTDEPLLAIDPASPANRRYYHADGLGSLVAVTDTAGALAASRRYDSFGRVLASAGSLPTYGYSGREPDASGLMYYRARYYAPELGRFTQPDPIGLAGGINRYAYVGGDPVNYTDPSGLVQAQGGSLLGGSAGYGSSGGKGASGGFGTALSTSLAEASSFQGPDVQVAMTPCLLNKTACATGTEGVIGISGGGFASKANGVRNTTPSPALKGSPYSPDSVAARVRPEYRSNPAHDPKSPLFNPRKTPEPTDAASVYQESIRADIGTWYGKGQSGWYRYFSDNAGSVHFSGTVPESQVPAAILRGQ